MRIIGENIAWDDGDTVVIRFVRKRKPNEVDGEMLSDSYTYRRVNGFWPGEGQWWSDKTDFDMTKAWHEYRLRVPQMESAPQPTQTILDAPAEPLPQEFWYLYDDDRGEHEDAVFADELTALRHAVERGMKAEKRTWGPLVVNRFGEDG